MGIPELDLEWSTNTLGFVQPSWALDEGRRTRIARPVRHARGRQMALVKVFSRFVGMSDELNLMRNVRKTHPLQGWDIRTQRR